MVVCPGKMYATVKKREKKEKRKEKQIKKILMNTSAYYRNNTIIVSFMCGILKHIKYFELSGSLRGCCYMTCSNSPHSKWYVFQNKSFYFQSAVLIQSKRGTMD